MAKDENRSLTPRLRFPEFRGPWNEVPLGSLGRFFRGLTYGVDDVAPEGLLVLRSSNIQGGRLILDSDLVFVTRSCPPELLLKSGDIAICMSNGSKALVGKSGEFQGGYSGELTVGAFCSIFRPTMPFAKIAFATQRYHDFVALGIAGGNINNLKNSDLEAFEFSVPRNPAEQRKIADCLTSLDEVIAAQGRKVEALKAHKKSLMQQLFPREGETRPSLRFPEFYDAPEWEIRLLSNLAQNLNNKRVPITENVRTKGNVPYYGASGVVDYVKDHLFDEDLLCVSEDGANLVARTYPIAFPISGKTWVNNHAHVLRFDNSATQKIVEDYLNSTDLQDFITGMAQPKLNRAMLDRIPVPVPEPKEQQRIAACLSNLDAQIAAEVEKLTALKTHKRGLMQQLFPSVEGARERV